ncbi:uncharacterized protein [Rutidosis leptorrhynchoides]|uniref:uncharacterized protein n=1 Tax=Rutidosis leptorrhynchoides TaxID=125765 RepID=UPI003A996683
MKTRSHKDQEFTHPFSDPEIYVHGVYNRREERVLRKNFEALPFCLEEMDPNGNPIHDEEGNPNGPPVNQELLNDPNDTPMWNARLVALTMIAPTITKPPNEVDNWKIEGNFFTLIKDTYFHGLIDENPFEHIQHFNDLCDVYKTKNVTDDAFKLRAFPFTLQGDAKAWMQSLPSDFIRSFQELTNEFINHFFPLSKVERLRMEINGFTQRGDESLYDAWVRFKKLLRACPPHAEIMLEDISVNTYEWAPSPQDLTRKSVAQVESENGQVTLASLNNQFQTFGKELKKIQQTVVAMQSLEEIMQNYIKKVESIEAFLMKENEFLNQQIRNQQASFQNLESAVGRLSTQVAERPQGTLPSNTQANPINNYNNNHQHNQNQQHNNSRVISIESTNQNPNNPNQNENVNAITTQSGLTTKGVEDPQPQPFITHEPLPNFIEENTGVSKEKGEEKVNSTEGMGNDESGKKKGDESSKITRPVPYAKAFKKDKLAAQYKKFQEMMKNVSVNLPITDVLKGMLNYDQFIKELISQRGKYHDETSFFIEEECNKILAPRPWIPKKLGDPGKFVFPCKFGESEVFNALADLGASINLMPHSLYERLGLGPLKPT